MKKTRTTQRSFRLWAENEERLDYATDAGLNATEIVNEVLQAHLRTHLEKIMQAQAARWKSMASLPIP